MVEGKEEVLIYEITSAIATHYIDQLQKIVPESSLSPNGGGCCIYWKNGKKSSFVTLLPDEREELIEVVGAHMKHFKQATIKQIQLIKDIYKCKSTKFDPTSSEHQRLLNRLWSSLMPEEQITGMVSPQWKEIGFQVNTLLRYPLISIIISFFFYTQVYIIYSLICNREMTLQLTLEAWAYWAY